MKTSIETARALRRQSTDAETKLWNLLRSRQLSGYRFRRQRPIGKFFADFACLEYRLIVELDGGQHQDNAEDGARTTALEALGWKVIRFWNNDILSNAEGVVAEIEKVLRECSGGYGKR